MQKMLAIAVSAVLAMGRARGAHTPAENVSRPQAASSAEHADASQIAAEALRALREGDSSNAIQGFKKLTQIAPRVAEFQANLGMAYYSAGRFREAISPYREALKLKPSLTAAHYLLGVSLAESDQCMEALPYLEEDYSRVTGPPLKRVMGTDAVRCAIK